MDEIDIHAREDAVRSLEESLERKLDTLVTSMAVSHYKHETIDPSLKQKLADAYLQYKAVSCIRQKISEDFSTALTKISRRDSEKWSAKEKVMAGLYIILILSILALFVNTYRSY